jgi:predicted nucleic acid-binding protein
MAMMEGKKVFIDSNILVYANNVMSPFCQAARTQLQAAFSTFESVWVSRQVFREFTVVVSREILAANGKVDFQLLESTILRFEQDYMVAEDSQLVTHRLLRLLEETNTAGKQVHDANIVATMLIHDVDTILTNNVADFNRFSHLITVLPLV